MARALANQNGRGLLSVKWLVPVLIGLEFFSGLVQGWILPLLSDIAGTYNVPLGTTSWVLAVGLLSSAVSVPLLSVLGDRFGHRLLLGISVFLAAAGSVLIALGPNFALILLGAAIQGPVAAFLPLAMALLKTHRAATANKDVGLIVGVLTFGVAAGSVLGGVAMDFIGKLHVVQLIPAVALIVFIPLVALLVPQSKPDDTRTVDWLGATLLGLALVGVMYGLSEAPKVGLFSLSAVIPLLVGLAALLVFLKVERHAESPIFDIPAMRAAKLTGPLVVGFLIAVTMFGNQSPPVLFLRASRETLGYGNDLGSSEIGIVVAISSIAITLGSVLSFRVVRAAGRTRALTASCLLSATAMLCMAFIPSTTVMFTGWLAAAGFGTGVVLGVLPGIVIERSSESSAASVAGVYNTARTIGGSLAGAFVASITLLLVSDSSTSAPASAPSFQAFQIIWITFAVVNIVAAAVSAFFDHKKSEAPREATKSQGTATPVKSTT